MTLRTTLLAVAAAAFVFTGGGCANNKLTAERDSLATQNKDLQAQLQAEREARQLAESRASAASGQLTALPTETSTPDMSGPVALNSGRGTTTHTTGTPTRTTPVSRATATTHVTIPGAVLFDSGKVTLNAAATKVLDGIAATIKSKYAGQKLVIEGYTDATPPSKTSVWTSNADLAQARATAVRKYLAKKGIADGNMSVKAMGPSGASTNSVQNRRVEVAVLTTK